MVKSLLLILTLLPASIISAQNITKETIEWNSSGFKDPDSNEDVSNSCQFITYGTNKVKWIQDNGNYILEWKVTSTEILKYKISGNQIAGDLTLSKTNAAWIIELTLKGGASDIRLKHSISSNSKL